MFSITRTDRQSRRRVLQFGGAGLLGLSLPRLLAAESHASEAGLANRMAKAKSVIFMMLFGGPSQHETFDLKPESADGIRGAFKPIGSRTPGLLISEGLPRLAQISDKFTVVRSMTHDFNDHSGAGHYLQTGKRWHIPIGGGFNPTPKDWPSMGSVVEYLAQQQPSMPQLPQYVVLPNSLGRIEQEGQYLRPGEHAGWLGKAYNPLTTMVDRRDLNDNPYWRDCTDEELTFAIEGLARDANMEVGRLRNREQLLSQFDTARKEVEFASNAQFDRFRERAWALVTSDRTRNALDIRQEPAEIRDRYGRHLFGQSTLLARRLVEAGARFVTVHYDCCDGYSWDSHLHCRDVRDHLLPTFDQGCATLIADLDELGLLDETLVVAVGEMGRTPEANADGGRGHWCYAFPALLAGGGIRRGGLYGATDKDGRKVVERPVTPEDLAATIYHALGIDHELRLPDAQGRPSPVVEGGAPRLDLFG